MTCVASLGMYDHPAQRAANDALWTGIARRLRDRGVAAGPERLDRRPAVQDLWRDPDLLFGQVCGYPLVSDASLDLQVLALPVYDAPGCVGDTHCSLIVVRQGDADTLVEYRGRRAAINDSDSNTGMNLFRAALAPVADGRRFFASVVVTGSHRDSARAVATGNADIAAIDAVTYAALDRFEPDLTRGLRIIGHTPSSPTLPFVTAATTDAATVDTLRTVLSEIAVDPALADARADLLLGGLSFATDGRFEPLLLLERDAARAGYPELR